LDHGRVAAQTVGDAGLRPAVNGHRLHGHESVGQLAKDVRRGVAVKASSSWRSIRSMSQRHAVPYTG
jgi:hypothetical protein